jgi:hypothetical protein
MRQAVVLIHGIGEQRPMSTVRGFVKAVLGEGTPGEPSYWSKPDRMSQSFELRRLRSRGRSSTDFYEYYWAYNLYGTKLRDVLAWLRVTVLRRWRDVPPGARSLWLLAQLLVLSVVVALALGGGSAWQAWYGGLRQASIASLGLSAVLLLLQYAAIDYLGDAARYLSPAPRNIRLRQKIRGEAIALLRALHASGEYDRIVLVGHSLGSVIAYDAITHLWPEFNEALPGLQEAPVQEHVRQRMAAAQSPQPALRDELPASAAAIGDTPEGLDAFRRAQVAAAREQRTFGNPWLITDLVTVGSPLAHGMLLLATDREDFDERRRERELPTCPPQADDKGFAYSGETVEVGMHRKFTPLVLHHAAPFAVTRWTNLYYPAAWGLFGDFVGGPLREQFGRGVKDVPVSSARWFGLAQYTPFAHVGYWLPMDASPREARPGANGRTPALQALQQALDLHRRHRFAVSTATRRQPAPAPAAPDAPQALQAP